MVVAHLFIYFRLWSLHTAYLFIYFRRPFWLSSFSSFSFFHFPGSKQSAHLFIYFLAAFLALILFIFFIFFISLVQAKCSFIYFKSTLTLQLLIYLFKNECDRVPLFIYLFTAGATKGFPHLFIQKDFPGLQY